MESMETASVNKYPINIVDDLLSIIMNIMKGNVSISSRNKDSYMEVKVFSYSSRYPEISLIYRTDYRKEDNRLLKQPARLEVFDTPECTAEIVIDSNQEAVALLSSLLFDNSTEISSSEQTNEVPEDSYRSISNESVPWQNEMKNKDSPVSLHTPEIPSYKLDHDYNFSKKSDFCEKRLPKLLPKRTCDMEHTGNNHHQGIIPYKIPKTYSRQDSSSIRQPVIVVKSECTDEVGLDQQPHEHSASGKAALVLTLPDNSRGKNSFKKISEIPKECCKRTSNTSHPSHNETKNSEEPPAATKNVVPEIPSYKLDHDYDYPETFQYQCSFCKKRFLKELQKTFHEMEHTGENPHQCSICYKMLNSYSHRLVHEWSHTYIKTYPCRFCSRGFLSYRLKICHETYICEDRGKENFYGISIKTEKI